MRSFHRSVRGRVLLAISGVVAGVAIATSAPVGASTAPRGTAKIQAIGAENEYGSVIAQIGGRFVSVTSILNNPNTDPHTFESSPRVAQQLAGAALIVQNGLGYDSFMNKIESASPSAHRKVITVQTLLGLPSSTPNPHLWYAPTTMPAVAKAIAAALKAIDPSNAAYFAENLATFDRSLAPWTSAIAAFKAKYHGVSVATTEPVADYLLSAMGIDNRTPFGFQADIMNGVDPSPEDISLEGTLLSKRSVQVFVYNEQVTDSLTSSFRSDAQRAGVPVVGVYETMPTPGYDYQSWMLAEVRAIERAVLDKTSTEHL